MYTDWVTFGPVSNSWTVNRSNCMEPHAKERKNVVEATPKFTLFWTDLPCTLRKLMLPPLLRLPQTFVTHCGSLCIFWYGKDTASSLQGLPITVPAVIHGACLLLWYWQVNKKQQQIHKDTRRGTKSSCRYCWHSFMFLCCSDVQASDELSEGGMVREKKVSLSKQDTVGFVQQLESSGDKFNLTGEKSFTLQF